MDLESDIDRLYQLPLDQFTAARNALAKELAGEPARRVKALSKPALPTWAVNQLYWTDRRLFDSLIDAGERLRTAHRAAIEGRKADVRAAQDIHRQVLRAAVGKTVSILERAEHPVTSATRDLLTRTLEALPRDDVQRGRLAQPLDPAGFELLAGLTPRASAKKPEAKNSPPPPPRRSAPATDQRSINQWRGAPPPRRSAPATDQRSSPAAPRLDAARVRRARETLKMAETDLKAAMRALERARAEEGKKAEALTQARQARAALERAFEQAQDTARAAASKLAELERGSGR